MANDDKLFELVTKMYGEMQQEFRDVKERLGGVEGRVRRVEGRIIDIENDHGRKLDALFDGYKQNSESLVRVEEKIDNLQIDVNNLTIRTVHNDSRIIEF